MDLSDIFKSFSLRNKGATKSRKALTDEFRNRVLILCRDTFSDINEGYNRHDHLTEFYEEMNLKLQYLHGTPRLSAISPSASPGEDVVKFLSECDDEHFLDFIEFIFISKYLWRVHADRDELVKQFNQFFTLDDLPYALTQHVWGKKEEPSFGGQLREVSYVEHYPKVVRNDDQVIHASAIEPALTLLGSEEFKSANQEFLEALEDFRKGDFGDSLTKCGSAFESTMKMICDRKGWPYRQADTSATLLKTILPRSSLESYFEQPLLIIATLRNRLSKSHGAGVQKRATPEHIAQFAINATASAILLLIQETR